MKVSFLVNKESSVVITLQLSEVYDLIRGEKYVLPTQEGRELLRLRREKDYKELKAGFPAVCLTCLLNGGHAASNIESYTGLIVLDLDNVTVVQAVKDVLRADKFVMAVWVTPSGRGLKVVVKTNVTELSQHKQAFDQVAKYFETLTEVSVDRQCSNANRLHFLSRDPDIYVNDAGSTFEVKIQGEPCPTLPLLFYPSVNASEYEPNEKNITLIETVLEAVESEKVDITNGYENWRNIGFIVAHVMGEAGRLYFHRLSKFNVGYDKAACDKQFTACLSSENQQGFTTHKIGLGTLVHICENHGLDVLGRVGSAPEGDLTLSEEKVVFNMTELMLMSNKAEYFWQDILPKVGVTMIASDPGVGKSTLAQQLCLQVSAGHEQFLGFKLHLKNKSAIYVATEDTAGKISERLQMQAAGLGLNHSDGFHLISADAMSASQILKKIDGVATEVKPDLIVVDAFGDVFGGQDLNSNTQTRKTLQDYAGLAKKHQCVFLFVHHVNKGTYGKVPSFQDLQGGGAIGQKVRTVLGLFKGRDGYNYLFVMKGNYTPDKYKKAAVQLASDAATFLFTTTGISTPLGKLQSNQQKDYEQVAARVFKDLESLLYNQLKEKIMEIAKVKETAAKNHIKTMLNEGIIQKMEDGAYKLSQ